MLWIMIACKSVKPAPQDIDGLSHYFWQKYDADDSSVLEEGLRNAFSALNVNELSDPLRGSITPLSREELDLVGKTEEDPASLSGVYFANIIHCPINSVEKGLYALNQDQRHEGTYEEYNRQYTSSLEQYERRQSDRLSWHTEYKINDLGQKLTVNINGEIRHLGELTVEAPPTGQAFIARAVLEDENAYFEGSDTRGMFQDYQLEVYFQRSPTETVHFFTIWREMVYTSAIDFSSETMQGFVLDGMLEWDADAEAECH